MRVRPIWLGPCLALLAVAFPAGAASDALARGEKAYARRADGNDGFQALPGPIEHAVAAYEEGIAEDPRDLDARVGLLRALFYLGDYVRSDRNEKLDAFERGQKLGEESISQLLEGTSLNRKGGKNLDTLVEHLRDKPHAAAVYYWTAVHWGLWGRHKGKIAAAKQGVAATIRDYATIVIALDPGYEDGGGYRMLGRLHSEAPRLPFFTGWIDREVAVSELEKARAVSRDALTGLYFAQALIEYAPGRRAEGLKLLREVAEQEPGASHFLEESRAIQEARALLSDLDG